MQKIKIFIILLFVLPFSSCKTKTVEKALTKTDMVSRTWICDQAEVTAVTKTLVYKRGVNGNLLELKDSFVTFFNDGKYQGIDFNATPETGNWKFKNNETVAELDNWNYDFLIVNLSSKNLDFNTKVDYNGKVYDIFVKMIPK